MNQYFYTFTEEQCKLIEQYNREGKPIDWKGYRQGGEIKLKK